MRVSNIKRGEKRQRKQKVLRCPQCGSSDLYYELGLITGYKYHCKDCQYVGPLVIEEEAGEKGDVEPAKSKKGADGERAPDLKRP